MQNESILLINIQLLIFLQPNRSIKLYFGLTFSALLMASSMKIGLFYSLLGKSSLWPSDDFSLKDC